MSDIGHFTPHFSMIYLFLTSLYKHDPIWLYICIVSIFDYALMGPTLKYLSLQYNFDSPRPLYPHLNGMPSGHTQLVWLLFVFFKLQNDTFNSNLFGLVAAYTSSHRISSGMHTPKQVLVGLCIGICMGFFWFIIACKFQQLKV